MVLEQNPSKQGLKPFAGCFGLDGGRVLEQNPSKQGLKHRTRNAESKGFGKVLEQNPSKQGLKQRVCCAVANLPRGVLEQNPSKQGLKLVSPNFGCCGDNGFRAKSIKTRIETKPKDWETYIKPHVLEQNPSKQGLKPH